MSTTALARQPRGIPQGGEFAPHQRADADVTLARRSAPQPFELPRERLNEAVGLSRLDVLDHVRRWRGINEIDDAYAIAAAGHMLDRTPGDAPAILRLAALGRVDYDAIARDIAEHYYRLGRPERDIADALGTWAMNHSSAHEEQAA